MKKQGFKNRRIKSPRGEVFKEVDLVDIDSATNSLENIPSLKQTKWSENLKRTMCNYVREFSKQFNGSRKETQCQLFQSCMTIALFCGQCSGLVAVNSNLEKDVSKKRLIRRLLKLAYCCILCMIQATATVLCILSFVKFKFTAKRFVYFLFYFSTCLMNIIFINLSTKWHFIIKQISKANLDEYIDESINTKCKMITIFLLVLVLVEHVLGIIFRYALVLDCFPTGSDVYQSYVETFYSWMFDEKPTYSIILGIMLPFLSFVDNFNWNLSHTFIICVSLYLTSILEKIAENMAVHEGKYMPATYWRKMREDYNRATRLVHTFDRAINVITFIVFANNMILMCLQIFFTWSQMKKIHAGVVKCQNYPSGPFNGLEFLIYYVYSLTFHLFKFLYLGLIASRVYTASSMVLPTLYSVPFPSYCVEVSRFIEQVHGSKVALSGLKLFSVTKELILSIAGTIVTYELVLLQFHDNDEV